MIGYLKITTILTDGKFLINRTIVFSLIGNHDLSLFRMNGMVLPASHNSPQESLHFSTSEGVVWVGLARNMFEWYVKVTSSANHNR